jgi:DNA-binding MarR family transcriptional regulator
MNKTLVDNALFAFLQAIHRFEQKEELIFGVSWKEILLLNHLIKDPSCNVSFVITRLNLKPFQATRLVDKLVNKNLVQRSHDNQDKRVVLLRITQEGMDRMRKIEAYHQSIIEQASSNLGVDRTEELLHMLFQLEQLLGLEERL